MKYSRYTYIQIWVPILISQYLSRISTLVDVLIVLLLIINVIEYKLNKLYNVYSLVMFISSGNVITCISVLYFKF